VAIQATAQSKVYLHPSPHPLPHPAPCSSAEGRSAAHFWLRYKAQISKKFSHLLRTWSEAH